MQRIQTVEAAHALRASIQGELGLVPTMGALHAGHHALCRALRERGADTLVLSAFVNPTQFDDPSDFAAYPRDVEADAAAAAAWGVETLFEPHASALYPAGHRMRVQITELSDRFEGASRPGHFEGVATVVTKLLSVFRPRFVAFGEKDFQQLVVVRRLVKDLGLPTEVVPVPIVRDADGLALSSRNARLSAAARVRARALPAALQAMQAAFASGERRAECLLAAGHRHLKDVALDYLALVDPDSLEPMVDQVPSGSRAIVAAGVDGVRLIDNRALVSPTALG